MENAPRIFAHETFGTVRAIMKDGDPWFVASDIAKALGYADPSRAVVQHCKKSMKSTILANRQDGKIVPPVNVSIIPETDVYRLVMRSNLPTAEAFQDWVCEDVLPSIRKTGSYIGGIALPDFSNPACAARAWAEQYEAKVAAQRESEARLKALTMTSEALAITSKALDNTTNARNEAIEIAEHAYQHQNEINDRRVATALGRNGGYVADRNKWKNQAEQLQEQVGDSKNFKTVKAIKWLEEAFNFQIKDKNSLYAAVGWALSRLSEKLKKEIRKIEDSSFGEVNAYHISVIDYARTNLMDFCKTNKNKFTTRLLSLNKKDFWKKK